MVVVGKSSGETGIGRFVEGRGPLREVAGRCRGREGINDSGIRGFRPENIALVEFIKDVVVRVGIRLFKETHEADGGRRRRSIGDGSRHGVLTEDQW